MFEAYGRNKYGATGVVQWMLNSKLVSSSFYWLSTQRDVSDFARDGGEPHFAARLLRAFDGAEGEGWDGCQASAVGRQLLRADAAREAGDRGRLPQKVTGRSEGVHQGGWLEPGTNGGGRATE